MRRLDKMPRRIIFGAFDPWKGWTQESTLSDESELPHFRQTFSVTHLRWCVARLGAQSAFVCRPPISPQGLVGDFSRRTVRYRARKARFDVVGGPEVRCRRKSHGKNKSDRLPYTFSRWPWGGGWGFALVRLPVCFHCAFESMVINANRILKDKLVAFWDRFGGRRNKGVGYSRQEKLLALISLSNEVIPFHKQQSQERRREQFNAVKSTLHPWRRFGNCFVCEQPATARHHIVQLQHGGINSKKNLVSLCDACHADIHPWL